MKTNQQIIISRKKKVQFRGEESGGSVLPFRPFPQLNTLNIVGCATVLLENFVKTIIDTIATAGYGNQSAPAAAN